jgi:CelD/BcsL family acetyltransferase involved in cellulose biosynthesis
MDALRDAWEELQERYAPGNVFLSYPWVRAWWKHFGADRQLLVLVIEDGGVEGIVPWCVERVSKNRIALHRIQFLGTGLSDRLDFLVPPDRPGFVAQAFEFLRCANIPWDVIDLREVPAGSAGMRDLFEAARARGLRHRGLDDSICPYLTIASDWETFFQERFGWNMRRNIRRRSRRLLAEEATELRLLDAPPDGADMLRRLADVPLQAEYGGRPRRNVFAEPDKRAFFAEITAAFVARGWLRLGVLEVGGRIVSFRYGFECGSTYLDYLTGYDRSLAARSPGLVMLAAVAEDVFRRRLREIDFLRGTEEWKRIWTDAVRQHRRALVFRGGPRGAVLDLLYSGKDWLDRRRRPPAPPANASVDEESGG